MRKIPALLLVLCLHPLSVYSFGLPASLPRATVHSVHIGMNSNQVERLFEKHFKNGLMCVEYGGMDSGACVDEKHDRVVAVTYYQKMNYPLDMYFRELKAKYPETAFFEPKFKDRSYFAPEDLRREEYYYICTSSDVFYTYGRLGSGTIQISVRSLNYYKKLLKKFADIEQRVGDHSNGLYQDEICP